MNRPVPNPGILDIAPYTPGKSPVAEPGRKVFQALGQRNAVRGLPKAKAAYTHAVEHLEDYTEGTRACCAKRSPHFWARLRPHHLRRRLGRNPQFAGRQHLSQAGDEAISTPRLPGLIRSRPWRTAPRTSVAAEKEHTADVDAILKAVDGRRPAGLAGQSEQHRPQLLPFD